MTKNKNHNFRFLIDECLSPALVKVAKERGYLSSHVSRLAKLKGKSDETVSHYALQQGMVVVTNNMVDFDRIYQKQSKHPGLIFLAAADGLMNRDSQILMFECALDEYAEEILNNEALYVQLKYSEKPNWELIIERYELP